MGRRSNDAVSRLVALFNQEGLEALLPRYGGGGFRVKYKEGERARTLREFERPPELERDGTGTWSRTTLQRALRQAEDRLPQVSTYTLLNILHEAGYTWQQSHTWAHTGQVLRQRKSGKVLVTDADTQAKKRP